jgi:hypothetical protein
VSFFGRHPTGEDRTLDSEALGAGSNATDAPTFGGLGALTLAELGGAGQGFHVVAAAAGLGKLIDNQLPASQTPAENHLGAWVITGAAGAPSDRQLVPAYPRVVNDLQFLAGPIVADIDGDDLPEALQGTGVYDVHAVDINGAEAAGWPKFTNGWMVQSPAVGDVDGDGLLEVIGSTREGRLFVWNTSGGECGFIPWRRWHHDEWGTGNYHTDARPPASLLAEEVTATAMDPITLRLDLARVPGDGLFCGTAAFDVRVSEAPIVDEASFAAAARLSGVEAPVGRRGAGSIVATDFSLIGRRLYVGFVARDEAGNRSALLTAGPVQFPQEEPPTETPSPSPTGTTAPSPTRTLERTPTNTVVPTATASITCACTPTITITPPATSTATAPPTPTVSATRVATSTATAPATATSTVAATATIERPADSGCAVVPRAEAGGGWWLLVVPAIGLYVRRRRVRC